MHTGRSAYNHLLALAQTHGIPRSRVDELIDLVGLHDVARKRAGTVLARHGPAARASRRRCSATRRRCMLDEPVNGLDPEGIHWIRNLLKALAAEGRTVFVSSHLMSEMALTADHLIVIGRGRLIADTSVEEFVRRAVGERRPRPLAAGDDACASSCSPAGRHRRRASSRALLEVSGLTAEQIGETRGRERDRPARADAAAGLARGGVHGAHPRRRRVQGGRAAASARRRA